MLFGVIKSVLGEYFHENLIGTRIKTVGELELLALCCSLLIGI